MEAIPWSATNERFQNIFLVVSKNNAMFVSVSYILAEDKPKKMLDGHPCANANLIDNTSGVRTDSKHSTKRHCTIEHLNMPVFSIWRQSHSRSNTEQDTRNDFACLSCYFQSVLILYSLHWILLLQKSCFSLFAISDASCFVATKLKKIGDFLIACISLSVL